MTPPILALIPGDNRATLRCRTNSPYLPVVWTTSLDSTTSLGMNNELIINVPSQGGFSGGERYYCIVRDPEGEGDDATVVGSARAVVRNVPRKILFTS